MSYGVLPLQVPLADHDAARARRVFITQLPPRPRGLRQRRGGRRRRRRRGLAAIGARWLRRRERERKWELYFQSPSPAAARGGTVQGRRNRRAMPNAVSVSEATL